MKHRKDDVMRAVDKVKQFCNDMSIDIAEGSDMLYYYLHEYSYLSTNQAADITCSELMAMHRPPHE